MPHCPVSHTLITFTPQFVDVVVAVAVLLFIYLFDKLHLSTVCDSATVQFHLHTHTRTVLQCCIFPNFAPRYFQREKN